MLAPTGLARDKRCKRAPYETARRLSKSVFVEFPRPYADNLPQIADKDLPVARLPGLGCFENRIDHTLQLRLGHHDLDLDFGHKVDRVFRTAVHLRVALLPAKAADLGHCHPLDAVFGENAGAVAVMREDLLADVGGRWVNPLLDASQSLHGERAVS